MQGNPRGGGKSNPMLAIVRDTSPSRIQRLWDLPKKPIWQESHLTARFVKQGMDFSLKKWQKQIDSRVLKLLGFSILFIGET